MKYLDLLNAAVLLFQTGSVIAGSCRVIEYAELKDTPSERLVSTYCEYGRLAKLDEKQIPAMHQLVRDFTKLNIRSGIRDAEKGIEELSASIKQCLDEQSKISSALKNRSEPDKPRCE